jgi:hypothetical protein
MNERKLKEIVKDPAVQIHLKLGQKQSELINDITEEIKNVNSLSPGLRQKKICESGQNFISLQEGAIELQKAFYEPFGLLSTEEKENLPTSVEEIAIIVARFVGMDRRDLEERDMRIFRLLEHLERRISDKRTSVNVNRATMFSLIAISISAITLIVVVILQFI